MSDIHYSFPLSLQLRQSVVSMPFDNYCKFGQAISYVISFCSMNRKRCKEPTIPVPVDPPTAQIRNMTLEDHQITAHHVPQIPQVLHH